jgi:cytoskeleton protein RodZ
MKTTGEILRKAREDKGLTLHEVGLALKISSKVLKAIEEGDDAQLPAKTFLRGFVLSYANYLHLDTNQVMTSFYAEVGSTRPQPYIRPGLDEKTKSLDTTSTPDGSLEHDNSLSKAPVAASSTPKTHAKSKSEPVPNLNENKNTKSIAVFTLGITLVALIIFTKKMVDKYSKEAEVASEAVEQTMEGATPVVQSAGEQNTSTGENTNDSLYNPILITKNPTVLNSAPVAAPVVAPVSVETTKPASIPTPAPTTSPPTTATVEQASSPATTSVPTPTSLPSPSANKPEGGRPVELIVEALDSVEIEYASLNGKAQKIRLSAEQVHTFKSKSGLKISFSNGGAVNLIVNGKEVGIPGDLGKSISLSY